MRQKIIGFFKVIAPNSTPVVIKDIDRELIFNKRAPIGTALKVELKRIEEEIDEFGTDFMLEQLEKESIVLSEIDEKIRTINLKSESCLPLLEQNSQSTTLKEAIKKSYEEMQRQGLDYKSNQALYETQATLKRRQMVIRDNPNLLKLDYNNSGTHTND